MKNYATPCAFYGTKEELDALIEPLEGLEYIIPLQFFNTKSTDLVLVTNDCGENGLIEIYPSNEGRLDENIKRISAPASNIPLCLALAAMVEGDKYSKGELVFDVHWKSFFTAKSSDGELVDSAFFPKATVPEIFAHFGVPFEGEEKKEEVREIVGYKAPFDIYTHSEEWIIHKGDLMVKTDMGVYYKSDKWKRNSAAWSIAKEIVETWDPVYKEVKKIRVEAGEYTKEELIKMAEEK